MKITDVEAIHLSLDKVAEKADGTQDTLIVKVHTDAGITGLGEVDSSPHVIKAIIEAPTSHSIAHGLKTLVVGEDPFEIDKIWDKMYQGTIYYGRWGPVLHAMSGIDIALWDIKGKALDLPVYKLMGGGYLNKVRAYASILFGDTPKETGEIGRKYRDQGYTAVKFGWDPMGQDEETDIALVREGRKGVGDDVDLLIDAGICWDAKTAIQRARKFQDYNIYWLEEPLHPDDVEGYAQLSQAVDVRIAAGEGESSWGSYLDLMDRGKIDVVQVDVGRTGLSAARRIGFSAHERKLPCVNHCYKTDVLVAASLHFLASIPNSFILEFSVSSSPLRQKIAKEPIKMVDGYVAVPEGPGLGVELNQEIVDKYRVA